MNTSGHPFADRLERCGVDIAAWVQPRWAVAQPHVTFAAAAGLAYRWLQDPDGWWQLLGLAIYLAIGVTLARTSGNPARDALGIVLVWPVLILFVLLWYAHRWSNEHEIVQIGSEWGTDAVTKIGELILWTRPPRRRIRSSRLEVRS